MIKTSIKEKKIKNLLTVLGFSPENGAVNMWSKNYKNNYKIIVDFKKKSINFGKKIKIYNKTANNFEREENFVVLECVDRLLDKHYDPECIILEKMWTLGHREKGYLDILVTYPPPSRKTFLMIECKTWGKEFNKAIKQMQMGKEQLFSYYQQDKSAAALSLYSSQITDTNINLDYKIIRPTPAMQKAATAEETFSFWHKLFDTQGYFGPEDKLYEINHNILNYKSLKDMKASDSGYIFNKFAEILRHHAVSDKPNAFNKMFALFLCKIMDEKLADDNHTEALRFQWLPDDDDIKLQSRLNDLYKQGMKKFLEKEVADVNDEDIDIVLRDVDNPEMQHKLKTRIQEKIIELRFYKNNEFSFKEVFDKKTFEENAEVVREVVNLLSRYKLCYNHKQKFLSDFFELLLQTGLKQETGQFFTPVPIAKFILMSLPIENIIQDKIKNGEQEKFLPYVIDYAAGSGHFLTEAMDRIHKIIEQMAVQSQKKSVFQKLNYYLNDAYNWAMDFVYGIEKDYRLVKTAKVSCFMYGDGLANVALDDGLAPFEDYPKTKPLLRHTDKYQPQDNKNFDILVANPPYSVSGFRETIKKSQNSFSLFSLLTPDSNEIECLFIERAKQLLKENALAAIILPSSILSNGGIHAAARKLLLRYFSIITIVELGSGTFMATGTNTVILFLRRLSDNTDYHIENIVRKFSEQPEDFTCHHTEKAFSAFVSHAYADISFKDYVSLFQKNLTSKMQDYYLIRDYTKKYQKITKNKKTKIDLYDYIIQQECAKLKYFMFIASAKILLIKSGEKQIEKHFLGYEFSSRRGHEGINMYTDAEGKLLTKLYDEDNLFNPEKASTHIYHAFLGEKLAIPEILDQHIIWAETKELINFGHTDFDASISTRTETKKKNSAAVMNDNNKARWEIVRLVEVCVIGWGNTNITKSSYIENGKYLAVSASGGDGKINHYEHNENVLVLSAIGARCGRVFYPKEKFTAIKNTITLTPIQTKILTGFLFYLLQNNQFPKRGKAQPFISQKDTNNYKIPLPPLDIQQKIINEIENIEKQEEKNKKISDDLKNQIKTIIKKAITNSPMIKLDEIVNLKIGGTPSRSHPEYYRNGIYPWVSIAEMKSQIITDTKEKINDLGVQYSNVKLIKKGTTLLSFKLSIGKTAIAGVDLYTNEAIAGLEIKPLSKISNEFIFALFKSGLVLIDKGGYKAFGKSLNTQSLRQLKIPVPSMTVQAELIKETTKIENIILEYKQKLMLLKQQKNTILSDYLYEKNENHEKTNA